jgi:hypothetical protein
VLFNRSSDQRRSKNVFANLTQLKETWMLNVTRAAERKLNIGEKSSVATLEINTEHPSKLEIPNLGLWHLLFQNEALQAVAIEVKVRVPVDFIPVKIKLAPLFVRYYLTKQLGIDGIKRPLVLHKVLQIAIDFMRLVDHSLQLYSLFAINIGLVIYDLVLFDHAEREPQANLLFVEI